MKTPWTLSKLKNGLRYMLIHRPEMTSVTAMVLVKTGSEYETKKQNGLAHFLEHMCFKGTKKRPDALTIAKELEIMGADYNAFTGGEYTGYYAKGQSDDASTLLDICADIFLNSTFPEKELAKEKGVVIEEINMREDDPQSKVGRVIDELVFGDQPAGRQITGTKKSVSSFSRNDLINYHSKFYNSKNTLVVVAGNFNIKKISKQIAGTFGVMKKGEASQKPRTVFKQKSPAIKIAHKESEQTHIVLAFHAYKRSSPNRKIAQMAANILGRGSSSRLFHLLREKLGVCYYVSAYTHSAADHGGFLIRAGLANNKLKETLTEIVKELKRIKTELVPEEELTRVKKSIIGNSKMGLETSDSFADYYGFQALLGKKVKTLEKHVEKYQKITAEQIQAVTKEIFTPAKANLAIVGPQKNQKELLKILKSL